MPRYRVGDHVRITDVLVSLHCKKVGVVVEVTPDPRGIYTLDDYTVEFVDNDRVKFWDIQLEHAAPLRFSVGA